MKDDQQTDRFIQLAGRILNLVSYQDHGDYGPHRRGHAGGKVYGADAHAAKILKQWVAENLGAVVRAAIDDEEFIEKCARKLMDTPTTQQLDTYRTFNSWKNDITREWLPPME